MKALEWSLLAQLGVVAPFVLLALILLELFCGALLVQLLTTAAGHTLRLREACRAHFCCLGLNYTLPAKAGSLAKPYLLHKSAGVPYAIGNAALLLEIFLATGLPALATFPALLFLIPENMNWHGLSLLAVGLLLLTGSMGLVWKHLRAAGNGPLATPRSGPLKRLGIFLQEVRKALQHVGLRPLSAGLLLVGLALVFQTTRLWLVLACYDPPPSPLLLLAVNVAALSAGRVTPIPMGLGAQDLSQGLLLASLGVENEAILLSIIAQRLFGNGVPLIVASLATVGLLGFGKPSPSGPLPTPARTSLKPPKNLLRRKKGRSTQ